MRGSRAVVSMKILIPREKTALTYEVYIGHKSKVPEKTHRNFFGIYRVYGGIQTLLKVVYHNEDIITKNKWRGFWFIIWYEHSFMNIELYDKYFSSNRSDKAKGELYKNLMPGLIVRDCSVHNQTNSNMVALRTKFVYLWIPILMCPSLLKAEKVIFKSQHLIFLHRNTLGGHNGPTCISW